MYTFVNDLQTYLFEKDALIEDLRAEIAELQCERQVMTDNRNYFYKERENLEKEIRENTNAHFRVNEDLRNQMAASMQVVRNLKNLLSLVDDLEV